MKHHAPIERKVSNIEPDKTPKDETVIRKSLEGDMKSFEVIVKKYQNPVYRFLYTSLGNQEDSEDLLQRTFIRAWKHLGKFDQNRGSFKNWLYLLAMSEKSNFMRYRDREKGVRVDKDPEKNSSAHDNIEGDKVKKCVDWVIKKFQSDDGEWAILLVEYRYKEITQKEAAEIMGCSTKTVQRKFNHYMEKLSSLLKQCL
ncbi:hypothetical protein MTBBW1_450016 [Desulfamplus magnetovallimortis]|uniref:RNA polymerase sigma-70 region 2 domain-containing protein n=1 Tax=Desulfamplus magnetovallimortis TaxID=1246637 RepID=A0A1W1HHE9_9BACT|nr:RNA polymerase sigma factor [Desulfamplus magnetovallimortis]SLM31845.1 hypothetical protein MTBBW1_450016 [Desulfamplus magnetovallimortis]